MENSEKKTLDELINSLRELKEEVASLEARVRALEVKKAAPEAKPSEPAAKVAGEPIDLDIDLPGNEHVVVGVAESAPVYVNRVEGEPVEAGPEIVEPSGEPEKDLFGEEEHLPEKKQARRRRGNSGEAEAAKGKPVLDEMAIPAAWKVDIPGPQVVDIRSAISLNDKVLFIGSLFRGDNALYQDTLRRLNGMKTLDEAEKYLWQTFPEWEKDSDEVYRFMMAVRRKIRK